MMLSLSLLALSLSLLVLVLVLVRARARAREWVLERELELLDVVWVGKVKRQQLRQW